MKTQPINALFAALKIQLFSNIYCTSQESLTVEMAVSKWNEPGEKIMLGSMGF